MASTDNAIVAMARSLNIQVVADKDNNTLLIVSTGPEYALILAALKKLDVPSRQVMMEVTVANVTLNDELNFGVDWLFNAWGGLQSGLYFPWDQDDLVGQKILELENVPRYAGPLVLEGGSVEVDGDGTLIATRECLLNSDRNPELDALQIETHLADYLGVRKIIWLERGVYNDETEGHIDNLARFARPGVVLLDWTDDTNDPQYPISLDAFERLSRATDAQGRALEVIKLPQPGPLYMTGEEARGVDVIEGVQPREAGLRLAASYVNFYCCNGAVIMPLLDQKTDSTAAEILRRAFPDRKIVPVAAREILLGGGDVHCITQQQPAARSKTS